MEPYTTCVVPIWVHHPVCLHFDWKSGHSLQASFSSMIGYMRIFGEDNVYKAGTTTTNVTSPGSFLVTAFTSDLLTAGT